MCSNLWLPISSSSKLSRQASTHLCSPCAASPRPASPGGPSFIPSIITLISIPTKSMGYMYIHHMTTSMTYLCCDLLGHDVSDHHLLNLLHLQSHILPHHVAPLSKRLNSSLYCWWPPRSSTAPSPTAAWPPGICYNVNIVIGFSVYAFRWGLNSNSQLSTLDQSQVRTLLTSSSSLSRSLWGIV